VPSFAYIGGGQALCLEGGTSIGGVSRGIAVAPRGAAVRGAGVEPWGERVKGGRSPRVASKSSSSRSLSM